MVKILQTDKQAFTFARQTDGRTKPDVLLKMQNSTNERQTVEQICLSLGITIERFRKRWERANPDKIGRTFKTMGGRYGRPTQDELDIVLSGLDLGGAKTDVVQYGVKPSEIMADKKRSVSKKQTDEKPAEIVKEAESEPVKEPKKWKPNWLRMPTKLEVAFYANMLMGIYGMVNLFGEMGAAFGVIYALLSAQVVSMVRDRMAQNTAGWGVFAVFLVECFTCLVHTTMFNLRTWQSVRAGKFPFDAVANPSAPFWIAFALAFGLCAGAFYSVLMTYWLEIERRQAAQFEAEHNIQY